MVQTAAVKGRIGLFLVSKVTGYQKALAADGERVARRLGLEFEVFSGEDTAALQSAEIVRFVHTASGAGPLGVILMPVNDVAHEDVLDRLARKVLSRGAAWIVLNRAVESHVLRMRQEFPGLPVALVTPDNLEIGRIQARQLRRLLPTGRGSVLYVTGNSFTSAARDRRAGLMEELGDGRVAFAELEGRWSTDLAREVVAKWLVSRAARDLVVDAVACQNDPMALGAKQALEQHAAELRQSAWSRIPVLGIDGLPGEGQRLVDEGSLKATIVAPPSSITAVELLGKAWKRGEAVPAKVVLPGRPYPDDAPSSRPPPVRSEPRMRDAALPT